MRENIKTLILVLVTLFVPVVTMHKDSSVNRYSGIVIIVWSSLLLVNFVYNFFKERP